MSEPLRLFVAATNDLEAERAVIGRALAALPVSIATEIRRTPAGGASQADIFELIANVDRLYFLLGRDITAPAGAEWQIALETEREILPLRSADARTPAAQEFLRNRTPFVKWLTFERAADIARAITVDVVERLQRRPERYGLTLGEIEQLTLHRQRLLHENAARAEAMRQQPGGAEGGGVLLDTAGRRADETLLIE